MPILWRYLLGNYLRVMVLCVLSFIAVLLVSRLQEIAHFATLGASWRYLGLFSLYQIPYILPIALPISCLLSAIVLFQRLSATHELTALRAAGLNLRSLLFPLLITGAIMGLLNFYITSELATRSHLEARKMIHQLTSTNPLVLLQNAKVAKLKGAYVQMNPIQQGEAADHLVIGLTHQANHLQLLLADKLRMKGKALQAERVSLLTTLPKEQGEQISPLFIENEKEVTSPAWEFARLLRQKQWRMANDHLKWPLLFARIHEIQHPLTKEGLPSNQKISRRSLNKCYAEIVRRITLGLAPFSFTLLGVAFGMGASRYQTYRKTAIVVLLAALSLISFFIAKEFDHEFYLSAILFLLPHFTISFVGLLSLYRLNRGLS